VDASLSYAPGRWDIIRRRCDSHAAARTGPAARRVRPGNREARAFYSRTRTIRPGFPASLRHPACLPPPPGAARGAGLAPEPAAGDDFDPGLTGPARATVARVTGDRQARHGGMAWAAKAELAKMMASASRPRAPGGAWFAGDPRRTGTPRRRGTTAGLHPQQRPQRRVRPGPPVCTNIDPGGWAVVVGKGLFLHRALR
jgi:hypothetical protein